MKETTAAILTIGDELLIGQVIDTNSAWIAQELNKSGIWVARRTAVGDVWDEIWQALDETLTHADIVLITGGLGPTADDITKPLLAKYFGGTMITDEKALANVNNIFKNILKRPMLEANLKQAEVPDTCTVIQNANGTAPGMWFEKEGKVVVSMPGVPYEMQGMMTNYVLPKLKEHFTLQHIAHRTSLVAGIGESFLAERIKNFENNLPAHVRLAYLPHYGLVRLRLTAKGEDATAIEKQLDNLQAQLKPLIQDVLVAAQDVSMETVLGTLLNDQKKTVATAESCTGGYISHLLTANPNSSSFFTGSVVCYDKKVKETVLKVDKQVLEEKGTVCKEVAEQLVKGVIELVNSDYAIAVTGLMGPDNGGEDKPVGTVWIGVGNKEKVEAQEFHFRYDRRRNIEMTAITAMNKMRLFILNNQ
ncbi:competence/damage-inducible protein A [Ilyomonas limi]|uniref:CinA-like protein n=1 Tax=Ilyomonas limi TaxID=2575867 RepID=A0A4U3LA08_9BACT|nr:competence/damage-inducible protein A [Ilyomonas limi]TKK70836.1 competence/damage-inducible protein A [Ilyomonas limi]